jgi:hypothetical protein
VKAPQIPKVLDEYFVVSRAYEVANRDNLRRIVGRSFVRPAEQAATEGRLDDALRLVAAGVILAKDANFELAPELWPVVPRSIIEFGLAVDVMQYLFPSPPGWTAGRLLSCTLAGSALDPSQAYCACLIVGACRVGSISGWPLYDTSRLTGGFPHHSRPDGFLTPPALRYTGRISYGLYLYHVPIFLTGKDCAPRSRRRPDRVELRRCGNLIRVRREAVLEAKRTGSTERRRWLSRRRYFGGKVEAV